MIVFLLPVLAVAEVLVWVSPQITEASMTTMTAACRSETRNGQPLLGTPLVCNSTTSVRDTIWGQYVVTPQPDGTNIAVGYGNTMLSRSSTSLIIEHLFMRADGTASPSKYTLTGCDLDGNLELGQDCRDWAGSQITTNAKMGCLEEIGSIWISCGSVECDLVANADYRVLCFMTLTASPTPPTTAAPTTASPTTSPTTTSPTTAPTITTSPTTTSPTTKAPTTSSAAPSTSAPSASPTADATVSGAASQKSKNNEWIVAAVCLIQLFLHHAL